MLIFNIFIILLLILISLQNICSLLCITNSSLEISRTELLSTHNSSTFQQLYNKTIFSYKKNSVCHVTIYIEYNIANSNITIDFGETTNLTENYISFETWFPLTKEHNPVTSTIDFTCSTNNLCDRMFIEKWIHWLAKIKHEIIQMNLIYLLTFGNHSSRCDIAGKSTDCSSGICIAEYTAMRNYSVLGAGCIDDLDLNTIDLSMKMESIDFRSIEYKTVQYICTRDNCNDESTFRLVWNETATLFDYFKPIVSWLRRRRNRSSRNSSMGKPPKTKDLLSIRKNNFSAKILIRLSCFIIISIIVGITGVYYYRHHRNRRAYSAASTTA
ncbi:hypothetical protein I4U23_023296 [Adineta vaga]|nr:hypothetical protein I4U23_023296 [Adineta vaga]